MTWTLTLAGLPRAGPISKPHNCKKNNKKSSTFRNYGFQRENRLKISNEKRNTFLALTKQPRETRNP